MGEIRQNKLNGQWVIYAPRRGERPKDFQGKENQSDLPEHDSDCPFCPGNEEMLPGILKQYPASKTDPWQTRVIPNKFPALTLSPQKTQRQENIFYDVLPSRGRHEVIIESPLHNHHPTQMSPGEMNTVIETYHQRYTEIANESNSGMAVLFRNHGQKAGTSLEHPHSQFVVSSVISPQAHQQEAKAQRYFEKWKHCILCEIVKFETYDHQRVVLENDSFLAFVPFAAGVPFETWIVPKIHQSDFGMLTNPQTTDLALMMRNVLKRLYDKLNDPDYNYVIHSAVQFKADEPHLHWYVQIQPRLTTQAGFEIGSGMRINPSMPEEDAEFLRGEAQVK